jgi:hypothetical protein
MPGIVIHPRLKLPANTMIHTHEKAGTPSKEDIPAQVTNGG